MTFFRGSTSLGPEELVSPNQPWRPIFVAACNHKGTKLLDQYGMIVVAIELIPYQGQLQAQFFDPSALGLYRNPGDCRCGPSLVFIIELLWYTISCIIPISFNSHSKHPIQLIFKTCEHEFKWDSFDQFTIYLHFALKMDT